jgi:transposase
VIGLPSNTRVWIVAGHTDMRKGFDGLAAMVQTARTRAGVATRTPRQRRRTESLVLCTSSAML